MTKNEIFVRMENSRFYIDNVLVPRLNAETNPLRRFICFGNLMDEVEKLEELEYQYHHYWRIKLENFIAKLSR